MTVSLFYLYVEVFFQETMSITIVCLTVNAADLGILTQDSSIGGIRNNDAKCGISDPIISGNSETMAVAF